MERYDGKTRKDDIKKYARIGLGVILVVIIYKILTGVVYHVSHPEPDAVVIFGAATVTDYQEEDDMEALMETAAWDLDGNGKIVVDVIPYDLRENEVIAAAGVEAAGAETGFSGFEAQIATGEGLIFITHDISLLNYYFTEEYLCVLPGELGEEIRLDISGCSMLEEQGLGRVEFYAGIRKDAEPEEYDLAVEILKSIK